MIRSAASDSRCRKEQGAEAISDKLKDTSLINETKAVFLEGVRAGLPIGLGYFAVAFSLGIAARGYGFSAFQGFLASLLTYASAGQYMGFSLYAVNSSLIQLIILTAIINLRYILMGFALNQRMPAGTSLGTRVLVGTCITDEIFGVTIGRPGVPTPWFTFGALLTAVPMWAAGTALGISMGNILPARIVSALSVALFGMFIAVIIPASKTDKKVLAAVVVSFACSYALEAIPAASSMSPGTRAIILTVSISAVFAAAFPHREERAEAAAEDACDAGPSADAARPGAAEAAPAHAAESADKAAPGSEGGADESADKAAAHSEGGAAESADKAAAHSEGGAP